MSDTKREIAIAMKRLENIKRTKCFAPEDLDSRPTVQQQAILDDINEVDFRYCLGGNRSGKTALGGREAAWIFTETHPTWKRPAAWGTRPITLIVIGGTTKQVENEIWDNKIKPFLDPSEYTKKTVGGSLDKILHKNGNKILFFTHFSPSEAREKLQAFTAEWLWLDEMPNSFPLFEELQARVQGHGCKFLATFTPKVVNADIRKLIDSESPVHRKYKLHMLSNPFNQKDDILAKIAARTATMNDAYRKTILEGDWYLGDEAVYRFNSELHVSRSKDFHPGLRHVIGVDPAASGKAGYVKLAEDPDTGHWTVIRAEYIKGNAARLLMEEFNKLDGNCNIVQRVSDPHEAWFIKDAQIEGQTYIGVHKKNERKTELIKNLQNKLDDGTLTVAVWCKDLIDEFTSCQWSERVKDKIVGSSRFHLLDALQYAIDNLPKHTPFIKPLTRDQEIKILNKQRKIDEASKANRQTRRRKRRAW